MGQKRLGERGVSAMEWKRTQGQSRKRACKLSEAVALHPKDKGKLLSLQPSRRLHRAYNKMLVIQRNGSQGKSQKFLQQSIAGNENH